MPKFSWITISLISWNGVCFQRFCIEVSVNRRQVISRHRNDLKERWRSWYFRLPKATFKQRMGERENGKRATGNGQRRTRNGERATENGQRLPVVQNLAFFPDWSTDRRIKQRHFTFFSLQSKHVHCALLTFPLRQPHEFPVKSDWHTFIAWHKWNRCWQVNNKGKNRAPRRKLSRYR